MLNLGLSEIIVIVVLAIVVVGPDRLPEMMRFLGRQYAKVMRASYELRRAFLMEADKVEAEHRNVELKRRREEARKRVQAERSARIVPETPGPLADDLTPPPPVESVTTPGARARDDFGPPADPVAPAPASEPVAAPAPSEEPDPAEGIQ